MEQSATPWRVFDAPSSEGEATELPAKGPVAVAPALPISRSAVLGLTGAVLVGAIAVIVALSGSGGQVVDAPAASSGAGNVAALVVGADLVVDVTGAVAKPGVYRLPAGSRISDAIDAAGGFSPRVDADQVGATLNLAAPITDGSQVRVPSRDDAASSAGAGRGGTDGAGAGSGALVDLNRASESELDALPGIGPVTAKKIIDSRTAQPFTAIDDLRTRKLVGEKTFDQLKSLVTVR